tara:strand:- start:76 stop:552 length:477 start_codon:yes stop_codon:yes gene_type:complete
MKNRILLVFIFLLTLSFSFAQNNMSPKKDTKKDMKKAVVKAVEYLSDNGLKFTDKQEEVCLIAFTEYAKSMMKVQEKVALKKTDAKGDNALDKTSPDKLESRKYLNSHAMRFSKKRDDAVKKALKGRQVSKYESLVLDLNPITLKAPINQKKGKKSKK